MKMRFLDEENIMRNFPLMYERRGETLKKLLKRWFIEQAEKLKNGEDGEIAGDLRESVEKLRLQLRQKARAARFARAKTSSPRNAA